MTLAAQRGRLSRKAIVTRLNGREAELFASLAGIPKELLAGGQHACPWCGGKDRCNYRADKRRIHCRKCKPGGADLPAAIQAHHDCDPAEALRLINDELEESPTTCGDGRPACHVGPNPKLDPVAAATRLPMDSAAVAAWCANGKRGCDPAAVEASAWLVDWHRQRCFAFRTHHGIADETPNGLVLYRV